MKFVDVASVVLHAGRGGTGCVSFRREKFVPKGGPDGGDGGDGGDVIVRANRHLTSLLDFQYKRIYKAPRGEHGMGSRKTGHGGADVIVEVPAGTIIRDPVTGDVIADLVHHDDEIIGARGGRGGRGNAAFVSSTNQAPRTFEPGEEGEEREVELELKLLADVGLVGLPNAGKSTLISAISAARPKIADYPFTTLIPNLGIVRVDSGQSFVVADIPGLIEGAHLGKGLGIQFLRHIERTRVLVFLLDATRDNVGDDFRMLQNELAAFNPELPRKPSLVVLTKIDAIAPARVRALTRKTIGRKRPMAISAVAGTGIPALVREVWKMMHRPVRAGRATSPKGRA